MRQEHHKLPPSQSALLPAAIQHDSRPTSMLSSASRASAYKHALLIPSQNPALPIDLGLPVQPILTTTSVSPVSSFEDIATADKKNHTAAQAIHALAHAAEIGHPHKIEQPMDSLTPVEAAAPGEDGKDAGRIITNTVHNSLLAALKERQLLRRQAAEAEDHRTASIQNDRRIINASATKHGQLLNSEENRDAVPLVTPALQSSLAEISAPAVRKTTHKAMIEKDLPMMMQEQVTTAKTPWSTQLQHQHSKETLAQNNSNFSAHTIPLKPALLERRLGARLRQRAFTSTFGHRSSSIPHSRGSSDAANRRASTPVSASPQAEFEFMPQYVMDIPKISEPEGTGIIPPQKDHVTAAAMAKPEDDREHKHGHLGFRNNTNDPIPRRHRRRLEERIKYPGHQAKQQRPMPSVPPPDSLPSIGPNLVAVPPRPTNLRQTLGWLRTLLAEEHVYNSRYTARPTRTASLPQSNATRQITDTLQYDQISPGSDRSPMIWPQTGRSDQSVRGQRISDDFTNTISHLEHLLNQALVIAEEAADSKENDALPQLLAETAAVLNTTKSALKQDHTYFKNVDLPEATPSRSTSFDDQQGNTNDTMRRGSSVSQTPARFWMQPTGSDVAVYNAPLVPTPKFGPLLMPREDGNGWTSSQVSPSYAASPMLRVERPGESTDGSLQRAHNMLIQVRSRTTRSSPHKSEQSGSEKDTPIRSMTDSHEGVAFLPYDNPEPTPFELRAFDRTPKRRNSARHLPVDSDLRHNMVEAYKEDRSSVIRVPSGHGSTIPNKREVKEYIRVFHEPPINPRGSSHRVQASAKSAVGRVNDAPEADLRYDLMPREADIGTLNSIRTLDGLGSGESELLDFSTPQGVRNHAGIRQRTPKQAAEGIELHDFPDARDTMPKRKSSGRRLLHKTQHYLSLKGKRHIDLDKGHGFSLSRSHRRQPIARDWSEARKWYVATVACISTALIGILIGIYAGEVPSIQYYIADMYHYAILGNVFFYIGLSLPVFFCWPLPLLHGRKPYVLAAMTIAMPLLFPQAIAVQQQRSPYTSRWRVALILPRTFMGCALGLAQMNFLATLLDLYGASLMSSNPHQELVDQYDVRRHGGGIGIWLGIWTWCFVGSIGFGFLIGAWIIDTQSPDWGFYVAIIIIAAVLLLNVVCPEVRRSAFRRSVAEAKTPSEVQRRLGRGEVMMHRVQKGPKWFGEEMYDGVLLSLDMLRQPGFLVIVLYTSWIYGQIVLTIVLLGSLMSREYRFRSPVVGVCTLAIPLGALLAIPFQKASLFSRARHHPQRSNSMTFEKRVTWSSHLLRRGIFTIVLPFAGLAYALSSGGSPTPWIIPILFAALIAFLSSLAIAECNGLIMETFDTSDLQPGMTGRPRANLVEPSKNKRTNYSSFPRIAAAFALCQGLGFLIAAAATGVGGVAARHIGTKASTGVMAGILLVLSVLLLAVLIRWKEVQIIPTCRTGDMDKWQSRRQRSIVELADRSKSWNSAKVVERPLEDFVEPWRPIVIGNPSGKTRRMSLLELGHLTRWSEIRRKNRLIDEDVDHPNLETLEDVKDKLRHEGSGSLKRFRGRLSARGGNRSSIDEDSGATGDTEQGRTKRPAVIRE